MTKRSSDAVAEVVNKKSRVEPAPQNEPESLAFLAFQALVEHVTVMDAGAAKDLAYERLLEEQEIFPYAMHLLDADSPPCVCHPYPRYSPPSPHYSPSSPQYCPASPCWEERE